MALRNGTNLRYIHEDSLGSTSVVTNIAGGQYGYMRYYPYGSTRDSGGSLDTSKKFTGQRLDGTGLYYYGARYYDPVIGRFISPDSIIPNPANPQSLNRYSYCLNNPLRYIDPTGHVYQPVNPKKWEKKEPPPPPPPTEEEPSFDSSGLVVGGTVIAGLAADDATVVGVLDDPVIIVVGIGTVIYTVYNNAGYIAEKIEGLPYLFSRKGGESDKSRQKSVEHQADVIEGHEQELEQHPNSEAAKHWKGEIETAKKNIRNQLDQMGPNARQKAEEYLRNRGIDISQ